MTSGGYASREQKEVLVSEIVTAPTKNLIDAAQVLPAMNAPQLVKQMYASPNSALPQRLGVAGAMQDDARYATSNLITGVAKQGGIPALGQLQINAQRRFSQRQQAVINRVMQVQKEAEDSDKILYSNQILLNKRRRDEGLQVMLNEMLSNGVETERLLHQQAEVLTQKHEEVVTEMQDAAKEAERLLVEKHDRVVTELQDAANETATLVEKQKTVVTQMQDAAKERETLHNKIITEMQVSAEEAETLHNKTVTKMQADARKEAEKHKKLVTRMEEDQKKAESNKRLLNVQVDALKKAEKLKYDKAIKRMYELRMEAQRVLIQKNEKLRTEVEDARKENEEHKREINARKEREKEMLQKQSNLKVEVEKQYNMYFSALTSYEVVQKEKMTAEKEHADDKHAMDAQIESLTSQLAGSKEEKTTLEKEYEEAKHRMNVELENLMSQLAASKVENTTLEKEHGEAKHAMNVELENLMSQLAASKVEISTLEKEHKESEHSMNSQLENLTSQLANSKVEKTILEKEHEESKQLLNAQLESLMSQLAALKEEKTTSEKEHEECKQILAEMNTKLESVESQLPRGKQGVTTVGKDDSELQLQLAELQEDKVKLQKALDALKSKINSKVDGGSMKLLWEVAEKVLTLPEDVRVCQSVNYASGYDTLLPTREENNVDKMMSCVHAALNEAAKNWKIAQADVEKIKWTCHRNLVDAVMGRTEPASETTTPPPRDIPNSETTAPPRDIPNHVLEYISDDSEDESMAEPPLKKRKRLTTLAELKKRQSSCSSSSSQQTKLPPKQRNSRRFCSRSLRWVKISSNEEALCGGFPVVANAHISDTKAPNEQRPEEPIHPYLHSKQR